MSNWKNMVALNANWPMVLNVKLTNGSKCKTKEIWWLWMLNWSMALNAKLKKYGDFECQANQWLWMPNWRNMVALNTKLTNTLNVKLWTMTLNAKLTNGYECQTMNNDSERQTMNVKLWMMALNARLWMTTLNAWNMERKWLWTSWLWRDSGSKHQVTRKWWGKICPNVAVTTTLDPL